MEGGGSPVKESGRENTSDGTRTFILSDGMTRKRFVGGDWLYQIPLISQSSVSNSTNNPRRTPGRALALTLGPWQVLALGPWWSSALGPWRAWTLAWGELELMSSME